MRDIHTGWIGAALHQLPNALVREAHRVGQRPTIRAVLYESGHKQRQRIASYRVARVRNPDHKVFTLVGGGVRRNEGWVAALQRELHEELRACYIAPAILKNGTILAMETVTTTRQLYQSKLVVIVAIPIAPKRFHPENLCPTGTEITDLHIGSIADKIACLHQMPHTPLLMQQLYRSAFSGLRVRCS